MKYAQKLELLDVVTKIVTKLQWLSDFGEIALNFGEIFLEFAASGFGVKGNALASTEPKLKKQPAKFSTVR